MTITEPTGGFDIPFNEAFQPDLGPPDVWTAEIGGNALECSIVRDSLTIRMGKDEPDPVGQADASTATFEITGDPMKADAPLASFNPNKEEFSCSHPWQASEVAARSVKWGSSSEVPVTLPAGTTCTVDFYQLLPAAYSRVTLAFDWRSVQLTTARPSTWFSYRFVVQVWSGRPHEVGSTPIGSAMVSPWTPEDSHERDMRWETPQFDYPAGAWVAVVLEAKLTREAVSTRWIQVAWVTNALRFTPYVVDTFEPGEKVVIQRNGLTVWTGWVTDEDRSWSPSESVSRVNAAGPRAQYNQRHYVPRWGTAGTQFGDGLAFCPRDPGAGGQVVWKVGDYVDDLAPYMVHGVDQYVTKEAQSLQVMAVKFWKGADLEPVMDLLDGAANTAFAQVWEKRDGRMAVYGHAYYRYEAPPEWYANDAVTLNCDEIGAPVSLRRTPVYYNSWLAERGTRNLGPAPDNATVGDLSPVHKYVAPPSGRADREYNPSPMLPTGQIDAKWGFIDGTWNRVGSLEQVDRWTVRKEFVSDEVWTKLLTMWLGWPVRITNLPKRLFRDNRSEFSGFLWGWELRGTDEISLTLIDKALFK